MSIAAETQRALRSFRSLIDFDMRCGLGRALDIKVLRTLIERGVRFSIDI